MPQTLHPDIVTATPGDTAAQLEALLHHAAIAPLPDTGWVRVTGEDRVRWLNGMVTNSIQDLAPGQGCYNFVLNAQGRIQGDLTAFAEPDALLLQTDRARLPELMALLDRFIIMDDVELADISAERTGLLVAGPDALSVVQQLGGTPCSTTPPTEQLPSSMTLKQTTYRGAPVWLIQAYSPLVPRYEIWADAETMADIVAELGRVPHVSAEALEVLRILEGKPLYGKDIRNTETARDLAQETAQTRALHFSKGCYLGQEIVERIRSRGNVHRTFTGFELTGVLPAPRTMIESEGNAVGEITSVATIPLVQPVQMGLGYLRREALERGLPLQYPGGTARAVSLPWQPS